MKKKDVVVKVYRACRDDVDEIVALAKGFFEESNLSKNLTLKEANWRRTVTDYIDYESVNAIIAVVNGNIVGYCLVYWQEDYTVERIGEMYQFYVLPEFRKTIVPRSLIKYAVKQYEEWGCKRCYLDASPGMGDTQLKSFENLWGKFGYEKVGMTMMRNF